MKMVWTGIAAITAVVALSAPASAQIKITCEPGTKPCGPICIPVKDECNIKTMGPTRTKNWKARSKNTKANTKTTTSVRQPQATSQVAGCASHTNLAELQVPEVTRNVTSEGWNAAQAKTRVNDAYAMKMIDVTQGTNRGSVGLFDYTSASQANIFAQRMNEFTNAVAVRGGPSSTRVIAVLIEEGDRAAALQLLQIATGCVKGDPSEAASTDSGTTDDASDDQGGDPRPKPVTTPVQGNRPRKVP